MFDWILKSQYDINSDAKLIEKRAIIDGMEEVVTSFVFLSIIPKKKSYKNTNDVYSYIKILSNLDTEQFINGDLREKANTGGTTHNYITQMVSMYLVIKTSEKHRGVVVYSINDPKVVYATRNNLVIER